MLFSDNSLLSVTEFLTSCAVVLNNRDGFLKARKFSRDSSESKRIKIEENVKKTSQDDLTLDDALDKKKKPNID